MEHLRGLVDEAVDTAALIKAEGMMYLPHCSTDLYLLHCSANPNLSHCSNGLGLLHHSTDFDLLD